MRGFQTSPVLTRPLVHVKTRETHNFQATQAEALTSQTAHRAGLEVVGNLRRPLTSIPVKSTARLEGRVGVERALIRAGRRRARRRWGCDCGVVRGRGCLRVPLWWDCWEMSSFGCGDVDKMDDASDEA